jgi:hypothetical protein
MFKPWPAIGSALLSFALVIPACAYDAPLTESSIREAYFLGIRAGGLNADYFARYAHWIPELKQWTCTSQLRFETPFLHVAEYASSAPNYTAQDAVKAFFDKPLLFKMYLDICYTENAPASAIKIRILQNKKEVVPSVSESSPFYPVVSDTATLPANGERIYLEFKPEQIDSSTITVLIDTPNGQHVSTDFDLQSIR